MRVGDLMDLLSQLGRDTEISAEELQAMLPHGGSEDRDFYLPKIPKGFYVNRGASVLTDPRNLRRL